MKNSPNIFEFRDYRSFLREYYSTQKGNNPSFSFRGFSRRVGIRAPNYLKLVIDGKRNLTTQMAARFAQACGLEGEEASFFQTLVAFNQATSAQERNTYFHMLSQHNCYRRIYKLDLAQAAYHRTWYLPAIREMAALPGFKEDPAWIAKKLVPPIRKSEARQALDTLFELGLLVRDAEGKLRQAEPVVSTGSEIRAMHVANYHRTILGHAAQAIDTVPRDERDISSLTLCLDPEGLQRFKERIQRFRKELISLGTELEEICRQDPSRSQQVVQVNMQLFPLSKRVAPVAPTAREELAPLAPEKRGITDRGST